MCWCTRARGAWFELRLSVRAAAPAPVSCATGVNAGVASGGSSRRCVWTEVLLAQLYLLLLLPPLVSCTSDRPIVHGLMLLGLFARHASHAHLGIQCRLLDNALSCHVQACLAASLRRPGAIGIAA